MLATYHHQQLLFCISALLLLLSVGSSWAAREETEEESPDLRCPDLAAERVCAAAESGFDYEDGCNSVTCSGNGRASTTLRLCPAPETSGQRAACDRLARRVWRRLGPFNCPNVDNAGVCERRGAGFAFTDGCNRIRCLRSGGYTGTRMACPAGDAEGPFCRGVADDIARAEAEAEDAEDVEEPRNGAVVEAARQCPGLHYSRVCAEFLPSFSYNDGCRQVTCVSTGLARVQDDQPDCPVAEAGDEAATAYCADAEQRMLEKKSRSNFHTTCLNADNFCRASPTDEVVFNDGCNRCFCLPDRNAACTRVACPAKFLTPEEFIRHCKRVGAGVLSHK